MTTFRWGSSTDTGRVRSVNQDNSLVIAGRLFALADGMGGHQGGEVASEVALSVMGDNLEEYTTGDLLDAVREANLLEQGDRPLAQRPWRLVRDQSGHHHILERVELGKQVVKLEDETETVASKTRKFVAGIRE